VCRSPVVFPVLLPPSCERLRPVLSLSKGGSGWLSLILFPYPEARCASMAVRISPSILCLTFGSFVMASSCCSIRDGGPRLVRRGGACGVSGLAIMSSPISASTDVASSLARRGSIDTGTRRRPTS
jgi:hypothetical protein